MHLHATVTIMTVANVNRQKSAKISNCVVLGNNQKCHIMCSKCLPSVDTHKRRCSRHSSTTLSTTSCDIADQASINLCFSSHTSFIGDLYTCSCNWSCSQLGLDLDCWGPKIWTNESGCLSRKQVQVHSFTRTVYRCTCTVCRCTCTVLLKDEQFTGNWAYGRKHVLQ